MSKITRFERKRRAKYAKKQLDTKLREEYGIKPKEHSLAMIQYSKLLTTVTIFFTIIINGFYYLYIIPKSGMIGVTDSALEYSASVLKIWNSGTIIFLVSYMAKALFETKFEKDHELEVSKATELSDKITEKINSVFDEIR